MRELGFRETGNRNSRRKEREKIKIELKENILNELQNFPVKSIF